MPSLPYPLAPTPSPSVRQGARPSPSDAQRPDPWDSRVRRARHPPPLERPPRNSAPAPPRTLEAPLLAAAATGAHAIGTSRPRSRHRRSQPPAPLIPPDRSAAARPRAAPGDRELHVVVPTRETIIDGLAQLVPCRCAQGALASREPTATRGAACPDIGDQGDKADEQRDDERHKSPHQEADTWDRDQREDTGGEDVVPHTVDEQEAEPADKIPPADPIHHVASGQGRVS